MELKIGFGQNKIDFHEKETIWSAGLQSWLWLFVGLAAFRSKPVAVPRISGLGLGLEIAVKKSVVFVGLEIAVKKNRLAPAAPAGRAGWVGPAAPAWSAGQAGRSCRAGWAGPAGVASRRGRAAAGFPGVGRSRWWGCDCGPRSPGGGLGV